MLIWILAVILLAIAGVCGFKLGAVRFAVSLVGLILAAALALPLGPFLKPLLNPIGFKNPIWMIVLPPFVVFLLIYAIAIALSFLVHRKVELHYKYHAEDKERYSWERVNRSLGLWVGLVTGAVWLLLCGVLIYGPGYLAVQLSSDQTNSTVVKLLNQARQDMSSTGLDKAVAPFDPLPPRYYEASDILGLLYQNPIVISRLTQYPPFLLLGDRPEFQEIAKDTEFNQTLLSKADIVEILKNPKTQSIIQNPELLQELIHQDLADLRTYLETGVSPKYSDERILGKWKLDPWTTMAHERKKRPDMSSTEMRQLRAVMTQIMPEVTFTATTDKKAILKAEVNEKLKQLFQPAQAKPAVQPGAQPENNPYTTSPQLAQRYGLQRGQGRPGGAAPTAQPVAAAPAKTNEIPYVIYSFQGTWTQTSDGYQLGGQDERGKTETVTATADEERLSVFLPNLTLVFAKVD